MSHTSTTKENGHSTMMDKLSNGVLGRTISAFAVYKSTSKLQGSLMSSSKKKAKNLSPSEAKIHKTASSSDVLTSSHKKKTKRRRSRQSIENITELVDVPVKPARKSKLHAKTVEQETAEADSECQLVSDETTTSRNEASTAKLLLDSANDSVSKKRKIHQESAANKPFLDVKMHDSEADARQAFRWLINPMAPDKFFSDVWEVKPLLLRRRKPKYYSELFSTAEFDSILRQHDIQYSVNIDITKYENDQRQTLNPVGRAFAPVVWDFYKQGCSVRLLNPQTFSKAVWKLNSILQDQFQTFVGANVYLTPPGTQGFAPHWDDIEAFILQLEGKKSWRVYPPRCDEEQLPRFSSDNFRQDEIGEPTLETLLEAGDLLYIPRGFIHQASAVEDAHSLHLTISCQQRNTWGDYLLKLIPAALESAIAEDVAFRRSLPIDYLNYMGAVHSDKESDEKRKQFVETLKSLMGKLIDVAPIDGAVDQVTKKFMHESLPPVLLDAEKSCTIHGGKGEFWSLEHTGVEGGIQLNPTDAFKLLRKHCLRLVVEDSVDSVNIYYNTDNSLVYQAKPEQCFTLPTELAPGVEHLIDSYPDYVKMEELPFESWENKVDLINVLYDKGLIRSENPLDAANEEEDV